MPERIGVYPGSFDPPTMGHLDLIQRAAKFFDKLIVAVANNVDKAGLFTSDERQEMLAEITSDIPNIEIDSFRGLTVDYAKQRNAHALVRGLRAISDFEYELTMATTNRKMSPECDTLIFMPNEEYMFISSRLVKEIVQLGGDVSPFVPPSVNDRLKGKFHKG